MAPSCLHDLTMQNQTQDGICLPKVTIVTQKNPIKENKYLTINANVETNHKISNIK